ncbi:hypothetical protein BGX26_000426 [Mortierella sp. AD094]|nr:hypothetical protein BGX26_000426 [Mortierella sp. AD094]
MFITGKFPKKESGSYEETLLDDISAIFGPHIEEISMAQDFYHMKRRRYSSAPFLPISQLPTKQKLLSGANSRDDSSAHYEVTAQVPLGDPQIHIGRWFHLHWLRELKIVYRATSEKPFFLHAPASNIPSVSQPASLQGSPMLTMIPRVIDFTPCVTLESLSIEDLDRNGRPQRLWRHQARGKKDVIPFDQDQGVKLPSKLKSFEMIGQSADRFNFGLLRATPGLECLQILGIKRRIESTAFNVRASLWRWDDVNLPSLKNLAIHHSPAQHFRFEVLYQCTQLESLDIRDIHEDAFRVCSGYLHPQSAASNRDITAKFEKLTKSRIEVLRTPGSQSPVTVCGLSDVLQRYFSNVTQLHLDGIPERVVVEATNSQRMPRLRQVLTKESVQCGFRATLDV